MNLLPDPDQQELVDAVHAVLEGEYPVRRLLDDDHGRPSESEWRALAALGWFGLGLPEDYGGVGLGPAEEMLLFMELGRSVMPGPILGSVLGAHAAALAGDGSTALAIASGETKVGLLVELGDGGYLVDGGNSTLAVAVTPHRCRLLDTARLSVLESLDCIDIAVELQRVEYASDAVIAEVADGDAARLHARGTVLAAAFQVGIAQGALRQTLGYVKEREQFGQPIGGFQAIKHRCADMAVQAEAAWSITALAAVQVADGEPRNEFVVASAKAVADRAARYNAATNVQNHGGIGYTWDYGAHLFVSRAEVFGELLLSTPQALGAVLEAAVA